MTAEPALIDLDAPSERPRRPPGRKISLVAALGMMVAGAAVGGAAAIYAVRRTTQVRVVTVSATVSADGTPRVWLDDGQVRLAGVLSIANAGATPIDLVSVHLDPAQVQINGSIAPPGAIEPGMTSTVSVIATLTCPDAPAQAWSGTATVIVAASANRVSIPFDSGLWPLRMQKECRTG
ncbi:hypothetical protein [Actinoplanes sp. NPDC051411]|uniref:hypothetical protein n=1 Tax=Actinoplanes sp. NPDC051411 TaxID=3155522 RepID=UPI0034469FBA